MFYEIDLDTTKNVRVYDESEQFDRNILLEKKYVFPR